MKRIILTIFGALAAAGTLGATEELRKNGRTGEKVEPEIRIETGTAGRQVDDTSKDEENGKTCRRMAVVELSSIYMRQEPDYESALETQELMGTVVEIVGEDRYWREIVSPQPYKAWTTAKGLVEMTDAQLQEYMAAPKVMFTGLYGNIYEEPSSKAATICNLVGGDVMRIAEETGRDARMKGKWTKVKLPSGKTGFVPTDDLRIYEGARSIAQGEGSAASVSPETTEAIIADAERLLGVPYLWGGMTSCGVDCSGLVRLCYLMNGIHLPRNASQQFRCGEKVDIPADNRGGVAETTIEKLERGDLLFFGTQPSDPEGKIRVTHVGIYLGKGKFIHASQLVRINSLISGRADHYENSYKLVGAVRL